MVLKCVVAVQLTSDYIKLYSLDELGDQVSVEKQMSTDIFLNKIGNKSFICRSIFAQSYPVWI